MNYNAQYRTEKANLENRFRVKKVSDPIEDIFGDLKPKMYTKSGRVNWWWILWNVGVLVARILFALKVGKKM